jgi:hypothetical protein
MGESAAACAMNCSSTHSPRCLKLVKRSQCFIVCSLFPPWSSLCVRCLKNKSPPFDKLRAGFLARLTNKLPREKWGTRASQFDHAPTNKKARPCGPRLLDQKLSL